jgi:hypothetical protein
MGDIFAVQDEPDQPQEPVSALNKPSIKPVEVEK